MRKFLLLVGCLISISSLVFGQSAGDYQSRQSGNWNTVTTWQVFNGGIWNNLEDVGAGAFQNTIPTSASGAISIGRFQPSLQAHTVTVPSGFSVTVDQVTIQAINLNALTIAAGGTLALNGTGADITFVFSIPRGRLNVSGVFIVNDNATIVRSDASPLNSGYIFVLNGGKYQHNYINTTGTIYKATWSTASTLEIIGLSAIPPSTVGPTGLNQSFYNVIWNCPGQADFVDLNGGLTTVLGNLTIQDTGGTYLFFTDTSTPYVLNLTGDLITQNTSNFTITGLTAGTTATLNIGGNFNYTSSGYSYLAFAGASTMNITGDFILNDGGFGGTFDLNGSVAGTINASKNFTITSGTLASSGGSSTVNFVGAGSRTFSNLGTIPGTDQINFSVQNPAVLDLGTSAISGAGNFTLNSSATIKVGSIDGLVQGATLGNIRNTGTRTYQSGGNIIYSGTNQSLGNEWAATGALSTNPVNLEIATTAGGSVTNNIIGSTNVIGNLQLTTGSFNIGSANTLNVQSVFASTSGTIGGSSTSNLIFSPSGSMSTLVFTPGSELLNNLTVSRTTDLTLGSNLTVSGAILLTGGNLDFSGFTLTMNGSSISGGKGLKCNSSSNLIFGGSTYSGAVPFIGSPQLNNLTFSTPGGVFSVASAVTINNALNLTAGALTHTSGISMAGGSTVNKGAGSISGTNLIAVSNYNVNYTGSGLTGVELPTSATPSALNTALNNLTVSSGGTVTLAPASNNVTINGNASFSGGVFSAGANNLIMKGATWTVSGGSFSSGTVTFSGATSVVGAAAFNNVSISSSSSVSLPAGSISILGNLVNDGTLTSAGTVSFDGTSTISGSLASTFNNLTITGILTAPLSPLTMNVAGTFTFSSGTFNHNNGTVVFNGTSSVVGAPIFHDITIAGTLNGPTTLNVTGNFLNNGTFNSGAGTVLFNGSTGQTISGNNTTFNNITSSNPSSVSITSAQSLSGALTLSAGTFASGGNLTLISNAAGDARIAQITGGATITGNIIVQRYLPNTSVVKSYRYIASPVTTGVASSWKAKFPITGTFVDPSTQAEWPAIPGLVQTSPSMYIYNEAHLGATLLEDKFETFPPNGSTSTSTTLVNGKGYAGFVRQTAPITLDITGPAAQGNVPVAVTAQSGGGIDGWNLIGNPYASPINWDNVTVPGGVGSQISFKDNTNNIGLGAGAYVYYTKGSPGTGIPASFTGTIPSGQAFWVHATSNATITFKEADKQAVSNPQFIRSAPQNVLRINVSGNGKGDEMVILFVDGGNDASDNGYDALKLQNTYVNLSSLSSDGKKMAINGMGTMNCLNQIPLVLDGVTPGSHTFNFSQLDSFSDQQKIQLLDAFTGTSVSVSQASSIYNFSVTTDPASYGSNRFKLVFGEAVPTINSVSGSRCDAGAVSLSASGATEGNYRWYSVATGGTSINGATGSTFITPVLSQTSTFYVAAANSSGCEGSRVAVMATVTGSQPSTLAAINNSRCNPGTVTITASGATEGSYRWYESATGGTAIAGATASAFTTPALNKTQTYYVTTPGVGGCEQLRIPVLANVTTLDPVVISVNGKNLQSSYTAGNQWYLNGQPIAGATGQTFEPQQSGVYKLMVTNSSCTTSAEREFVVTGLEENLPSHISISPNPTKGVLSVAVESSNEVSAKVVSLLGVTLHEKLLEGGSVKKGSFNLEDQTEGMYIMIVQDGSQVYKTRIVKKQ